MPTIVTVMAVFVFIFLVIGVLVFVVDKKQKRATLRKMKDSENTGLNNRKTTDSIGKDRKS